MLALNLFSHPALADSHSLAGPLQQAPGGIPLWLWLLLPLAVLLLWLGRRQPEDGPSAASRKTSTIPATQEPAPETSSALVMPVVPPETIHESPAPVTAAPEEKAFSPQAYYDQGWQLIESGQLTAAVTAFDQALQANADWALAYLGKGTALLKLERYAEAIASFDAGMPGLTGEDMPRLPGGVLFAITAWLNRGRAKLKLGQTAAALSDFEQALQLDSTSVEATRAKGDALLGLGQQQEADECYRRANELSLSGMPASAAISKAPANASEVSASLSFAEPSEPESPDIAAESPPAPVPASVTSVDDPLEGVDTGAQPEPVGAIAPASSERQSLTIQSQRDCYALDSAQMDRLQDLATTLRLAPGSHTVRIASGTFSYWTDNRLFDPEPWVILWIYGGRFLNLKTQVEVGATWSTLNGYDDRLTLEVQEAATLCALFLDTYIDDNSGQIVLSVSDTETLTVDSRENCYLLDEAALNAVQTHANSTQLAPGTYVFQIEKGVFCYWSEEPKFAAEPWVMLWIYGGAVVNERTQVKVGATWASLNGYEDTVTLTVLETTTVSGLFFDTYKDDNSGEITLSITQKRA